MVCEPYASQRLAQRAVRELHLEMRYTVTTIYLPRLGAWVVQCRLPRSTEPLYLRVDGGVR